jgi:hypothetical protein
MASIETPVKIFVGGAWEAAPSKVTREIRNPANGANREIN